MEPTLILLSATVGALVGTSVGVLLMFRKMRPPISETDVAVLRSRLATAEEGLTKATANVADLRKLAVEREEALGHLSEEARTKQQELDLALAKVEDAAAVEAKTQELTAQIAVLQDRQTELEAAAREKDVAAEELTKELLALEAQRDLDKTWIQKLTQQIEDLQKSAEQDARQRAELEAQLSSQQERSQELAAQITEFLNDRLRLESGLQEERKSAAKGMEYLLRAQENFSRAFGGGARSEMRNGDYSNGHHKAADPGFEMQSEPSEEAQSAVSST